VEDYRSHFSPALSRPQNRDSGHLNSRTDGNQPRTETFYYDNLHRLDYSQLDGVTNLDLSYDAVGNISYKSDVGSYSYGTSRIHAATAAGGTAYAYDANGNIQTRGGASVTWTPSNKPRSIGNGNYTSAFEYNADDQYWKQTATYSNGTETSTYLGGLMEIVSNSATGITAWRHHISAYGRTVAIYSRGSNGANNTNYPLIDHLGSTDAITNDAGAVIVRESFGPFGNRRGSGWSASPSSGDWTTIANSTRRGFTAHTMLDNLTLIHMNGRVFDPVVGRFVSADPIIDGETNPQGWNRYSYVKNNPLSFTDPTGYKCEVRNKAPTDVSEYVCTVDGMPEKPSKELLDAKRTLEARYSALVNKLVNSPLKVVTVKDGKGGMFTTTTLDVAKDLIDRRVEMTDKKPVTKDGQVSNAGAGTSIKPVDGVVTRYTVVYPRGYAPVSPYRLADRDSIHVQLVLTHEALHQSGGESAFISIPREDPEHAEWNAAHQPGYTDAARQILGVTK
jgi:RHS repeat-associated protein